MLTFLDISQYQGDTPESDFLKIANHQIEGQYVRGVIARAVAADQHIDAELIDNLTRARATGRLWTGAYHNLINSSVSAQFARFRDAVPDWKGVIPMVDSEQGASMAQLTQFQELAHLEWGVYPLVYLPYWYWSSLSVRTPLDPRWTWVHSDYPPYGTPFIPPHTSLKGQVWQYTSSYVIPGITENTVDLNRYYGDEAVLLQLAVQ